MQPNLYHIPSLTARAYTLEPDLVGRSMPQTIYSLVLPGSHVLCSEHTAYTWHSSIY